MRCGTIGSCQSAAIREALLVTSLTHVSGAKASIPTFTFTFIEAAKRLLLQGCRSVRLFLVYPVHATVLETKSSTAMITVDQIIYGLIANAPVTGDLNPTMALKVIRGDLEGNT